MRLLLDGFELVGLFRGSGDNELPAAPVRHAVRDAILVEELLAGDTRPRLKRPLGVVDAGVDHFGVARARVRADRVFRFQHYDLAPGARELARYREADHARADHDGVDAFHR